MDPKVLLLFALLAPVLVLAAGVFVGRQEKKEAARLQTPLRAKCADTRKSQLMCSSWSDIDYASRPAAILRPRRGA